MTNLIDNRIICTIIIIYNLRTKPLNAAVSLARVRGTADTDGGAYSPFRSIFLVLTHDFIIIQLYGPACGDG